MAGTEALTDTSVQVRLNGWWEGFVFIREFRVSILSLMMPDDAGNASHALAHFLAMVVGAAIGGILFVRLDTLVNQHGGYLRKASITLAHIAVRHRADVRKQLQGVLDVSPFDSLPRERMKRLDQHLVTRLSRRARPTCKSGD